MQDIRASLERVRERIARAAARAGRRAEDVLLIGVSKAVEPVRIREAVAAGVPALGENRVQEARAKIAELGRAGQGGRPVEALVQVNVAGEASKGGVAPEGLGDLLDAVTKLDHVRVRGLMVIPPEARDPTDARVWFRTLAKLRERHGLRELSMGMSGDFEVAIEEGATMVRVGTAIFGPRPAAPLKEPRER